MSQFTVLPCHATLSLCTMTVIYWNHVYWIAPGKFALPYHIIFSFLPPLKTICPQQILPVSRKSSGNSLNTIKFELLSPHRVKLCASQHKTESSFPFFPTLIGTRPTSGDYVANEYPSATQISSVRSPPSKRTCHRPVAAQLSDYSGARQTRPLNYLRLSLFHPNPRQKFVISRLSSRSDK